MSTQSVEQSVSALVLVESMTPAKIFEPGAIDPILDRIKAEVRAIKKDISTENGRKQIASLAYKISRTKTFIDEQRVALVADEKKRLKRIDVEGKRVRDDLDSLRDEVRKPLTDWENAEKARIQAHEEALTQMTIFGMPPQSVRSVGDVDAEIAKVKEIFEGRQWQEFSARAIEVRDNALFILSGAKEDAVRREAEKAELERLRKQEEERLQLERDERIAREAREQAEHEAKEREEEAARIAEAERQRIEREAAEREADIRRETEERVRQAEEARIASELAANNKRISEHQAAISQLASFTNNTLISVSALEQRIAWVESYQRDWEEFVEKAELIRTSVLGQLQQALNDAREKERFDAEQARAMAAEEERERLDNIRKADEEATAAREADRKWRTKIHKEAILAIANNLSITGDKAAEIVGLIADGKVPHVSIAY